ncbi:MAG: TetR/AcrR family transcriptional regulator [Myxococcota bacterium]
MSTSTPARPRADAARPVQRRARETRQRIERAALEAFADAGFDGASTGGIAKRAGVTQQNVIYHYETKLSLWQAVADGLFERVNARTTARLEGLAGVDEGTRARLMIAEFVRFSAEVPELARFMMHEGSRDSDRLDWIVERHLRSTFELLVGAIGRAQDAGAVTRGDPVHLFFLMLGSAAVLAQPAQSRALSGRDLAAEDEIDAYAELVVRLFSAAERRENE